MRVTNSKLKKKNSTGEYFAVKIYPGRCVFERQSQDKLVSYLILLT